MSKAAPCSNPLPLSSATLADVPFATPAYDRNGVRASIVHIGVGGFHRAHQAMYLDQLMNQGLALDWGICGMGVLPGDVRTRDALAAQDYLYTLVVKHPDGSTDPRVIGSIIDFVHAPDDPERAVERLADPATRIVSLTITEGGYNFNQAIFLSGFTQVLFGWRWFAISWIRRAVGVFVRAGQGPVPGLDPGIVVSLVANLFDALRDNVMTRAIVGRQRVVILLGGVTHRPSPLAADRGIAVRSKCVSRFVRWRWCS
jgi:hypothetical protein